MKRYYDSPVLDINMVHNGQSLRNRYIAYFGTFGLVVFKTKQQLETIKRMTFFEETRFRNYIRKEHCTIIAINEQVKCRRASSKNGSFAFVVCNQHDDRKWYFNVASAAVLDKWIRLLVEKRRRRSPKRHRRDLSFQRTVPLRPHVADDDDESDDEEQDGHDDDEVADLPMMTPVRSNPKQRMYASPGTPPPSSSSSWTKRGRSPPTTGKIAMALQDDQSGSSGRSNVSSNGSPRRSSEITDFDIGSFGSNISSVVSDGYVSGHHHSNHTSPGPMTGNMTHLRPYDDNEASHSHSRSVQTSKGSIASAHSAVSSPSIKYRGGRVQSHLDHLDESLEQKY